MHKSSDAPQHTGHMTTQITELCKLLIHIDFMDCQFCRQPKQSLVPQGF
jgi:hypothetical protein